MRTPRHLADLPALYGLHGRSRTCIYVPVTLLDVRSAGGYVEILERKGGTNPPSIRWQRIVISLYYIRKLGAGDRIRTDSDSLEGCVLSQENARILEDPSRFELESHGLKGQCFTY